jgi:hypothetical protein
MPRSCRQDRYILRPRVLQWGQDASLFKVIAINEHTRLRINADFFNVFNHPGNPNSVGGMAWSPPAVPATRRAPCN